MKIVALCLIFCLCTGVGAYKSFAVRMRSCQLRGILDCFRAICSELKYSKTSADGLRDIFSRFSAVPLLEELARTENLSPKAAYEKAWNKVAVRMYISLSDKTILDRFFDNFGKESSDIQLQLCDRTVGELQEAYEGSVSKSNKYCRLYAILGFMSGLFFVLVLA